MPHMPCTFLVPRRREDGDQEFVTLAAMLLCGDLELRPDTFQQITAKPEVSPGAPPQPLVGVDDQFSLVGALHPSLLPKSKVMVLVG